MSFRLSAVSVTLALVVFCLHFAVERSFAGETGDPPQTQASQNPGSDLLPLALDLGQSRHFNGFFLESFESTGSGAGGRLAAGAQVSITEYSIAGDLSDLSEGASLIVGGDLTYPDGQVHRGDILVAGSAEGLGEAVIQSLSENQSWAEFVELPFDIDAEFERIRRTSQQLTELPPSGTAQWSAQALSLEGDCESRAQVFELSGQQLLDAETVTLHCIPGGATIIVNVDGSQAGLANIDLQSLASHREKLLFNFHQAEELFLLDVALQGSILAPLANVVQPTGLLKGTIIASSWDGPMQLDHAPFKGAGIGDFCAMYPIALPFDMLETAEPGSEFVQMPRGTGPGNYSWLTWAGSPAAPTLAQSLVAPGDSYTYVNQDDNSDWLLTVGDWAQGATGAMNSKAIRDHLDALLGEEIVVPAWSEIRDRGNNLDYQVAEFARIRLLDYRLPGNGWLSFEFLGFSHCYNRPPEAFNQHLETEANISLEIELTGEDPDGDDLTFQIVRAPEHGTLEGEPPFVQYIPETDFVGTASFNFLVDDGYLQSNPATVIIDVIRTNLPPEIISEPPTTAEVGEHYEYLVDAIDPDGDILEYSLLTAHPTLEIGSADGRIAGLVADGTWAESVAAQNRFCSSFSRSVAELDVELRWEWKSGHSDITSDVYGPPMVARIVDINGDGVVDERDPPTVVFAAYRPNRHAGAYLVALNGDTGEELWVSRERAVSMNAVAVADITGDGRLEIITLDPNFRTEIIVFNHRGELLWTAPTGPTHFGIGFGNPRDWVSVADLNGDGSPEVIHGNRAFSGNGEVLWVGAHETGGYTNYGIGSIVADLDQDGFQEVIAGRVIYNYDGQVRARNTSLPAYGFNAVADFTGDGEPEIVYVAQGRVYLLDANLNIIWGNRLLPGGGDGGPPTIADFTGDGHREIGVAARSRYVVYDRHGNVVWERFIQDFTSHRTGSSVFDFEGDGRASVLFADEVNFWIFDGPTGASQSVIDAGSSTHYEYPIVVDATGDGFANIVVPTNFYQGRGGGVRLYESSGLAWMPTRSIWNQHAYHISNINDDGTVPASPRPSWKTHNTYRLNSFADGQAFGLPDLSIRGLQLFAELEGYRLTAEIENRGLADYQEVVAVEFYTTDIHGNNRLLGTASVNPLARGENQIVALGALSAEDVDNMLIGAVIRAHPEIEECNQENHWTAAWAVRARATDPGGLFDQQLYLLRLVQPNRAPVISSSPLGQIESGQLFQYSIVASDPDRGDQLRYSLISAPRGMWVNSTTGEVFWRPGEEHVGINPVVVEVRDLAGASDEQAFEVEVLPNSAITPPPYFLSEPVTRATVNNEYRYLAEALSPGGFEIEYGLTVKPTGMEIDSISGEIIWAPTHQQSGSHLVVVRARDESLQFDLQEFIIQVSGSNQPPVFLSEPVLEVSQGDQYVYHAFAEDPDGDSVSYHLWTGPAGMEVDASSGLVTWNTQGVFPTSYLIELVAHDGFGGFGSQTFELAVVDSAGPYLPPQITSTPPLAVNLGSSWIYQVEVTASAAFEYLLVEAPTGATLNDSGLTEWAPDTSQLGEHAFVIEVHDEWGGRAIQSFSVYVNDPAINSPPEITSTPLVRTIIGNLYNYQVEAVDPDGDELEYSLAIGPGGATIDLVNGLVTWVPDVSQLGLNQFEIHVSDGNGGLAWQRFEVLVESSSAVNNPPVITSMPPLAVNLGEVWVYQVDAFDPDGDPLEYLLIQGSSGASMDESGLFEWTPNSSQLGENKFVIEVHDDRGGLARQSFSVYVNDATVNSPPEIVSTPPLTAFVGLTYSHQIDAVDPDGDVLEYVLASGPSGAAIDSEQGSLTWIPLSAQIGSNEFEIHVFDGQGGIAWQRFTVIVEEGSEGNRPPIIHSAPPLTAKVGFGYAYNIDASHPDGFELTFNLADGPSGMEMHAASGALSWLPEAEGIYPVTIEVSDGEFIVWQSWQLDVLDGSFPLDLQIEITPTVADIGQTVEIRLIPEASAGQVVAEVMVNDTLVVVDSDLIARYVPAQAGEHLVIAAIDDGFEQADASGSFFVRDQDAEGGPFVSLLTPDYEAEITAPTMVVGTVQDDQLAGWVLAWTESGTQNWNVMAEGTGPVDEAELAEFDPTLLANGLYRIALQAWDTQGRSSSDSRVVIVTGDMKLGHFAITFEDLSIPVMGIPISVSRTYDTRQRHRDLDFGFGWSIDYQNVRVQESRLLGLGWEIIERRSGAFGIFVEFCVLPRGKPLVTVTLPGGQVETFEVRLKNECNDWIPVIDFLEFEFRPVEGTFSTLTENDFSGGMRLLNGNLVENHLFSTIADPTNYTLTTREGFVYQLDQNFGIRTVTDPNDNTLTYTNAGIIHSSGMSVDFHRDASGRITEIVDPMGNVLSYQYDGAGDLIAFEDREDQVTQFVYLAGQEHYLEEIIDPRGIRAIRNEYDEGGRLVAQIDADGNRMEFTHDIDGRMAIIRDRLGNPTVYVYDDYGNVTSETNALGETTFRTYDDFGNELTRTDSLGHVWTFAYDSRFNVTEEINPLGEINQYTFNSNDLLMTNTAPDGTVLMSNLYDGRGNPTAITDALGNRMEFDYEFFGLPSRTTDALGQETQYLYDSLGYVVREVAPSGVETAYTNDEVGNVLTETVVRINQEGVVEDLITIHEYDANGNRIRTIDPLGSVRESEYDAAGQLVAEVDPLGRRTEYEFDNRGNQILVRYPDGSTATSEYDAEGNLVAETNRAGRTTRMVYDSAGRLIETILPDGTPDDESDNPRRYSIYDAAGRLVEEVDERGHSTFYEYDAAGRNTKVVDVLGNETVYEYDTRGQRIAMIDARGNRTEHEYDAAGNLVRTILPNGTETTVEYDALGQRTAETDPSGRTTRFEYDARGNLTAVVDASNERTEYGYDGQDNRISQTDANGHTTSWRFDVAGRLISRTLPMGQTETFQYDIAGHRTAHTDFKGQAVEYQYDELSRPIRTEYPGNVTVETRYHPSGQVWEIEVTCTPAACAQVGKEAGVTLHLYDDRDRLARIQYPAGHWIEYSYDEAGNRTEVRTENQRTRYTFDALNRMSTVISCANSDCSQGQATVYHYNEVGSRTAVVHANGTATEYQYDQLNRLTLLTTWDAFGEVIHRQAFTLGAAGHREILVEDSQRVVEYSYDALYRLTEEKVTDPAGDRTTTYTFDATGNRLSRSVSCDPGCFGEVNAGLTIYVYDANDRLLEETGPVGVTTYSYDDNGNTIRKTAADSLIDYKYNADDRLVSATGDLDSGATMTEYAYDAHGIRQRQTVDGLVARFLVDPTHQYAQVIEELDGLGNAVVSYVIGHERISQTRSYGTHNYHADGLGSIRALTDETGTRSDRYVYEAFGLLEHLDGTTPNNFRYTGEQFDSNLGFYYLRARYYSATVGRFPTMDSFWGLRREPLSLHKYLYNHSDPINRTDPSGNISLIGLTIGIGISATLAVASFSTYGYLDVRPHTYDAENAICQFEVQFNCSERRVFDVLRRFPAPGAHGLYAVTSDVESFARPFGWVSHEVDLMNYRLKNITIEGRHLLHPGEVLRSVVSSSSGVSISTFGSGTGRFATYNEKFAKLVWGNVDRQIRNEF